MGKERGGPALITEMIVNNRRVQSVPEIAGGFNDTFVLPEPCYDSLAAYACVGPSANCNFFLAPVGVHEILLYLRGLPPKRSAGWDEIPMFLMKRVALQIAAPLADVVNCSFSEGVFPAQMKRAVVTPRVVVLG